MKRKEATRSAEESTAGSLRCGGFPVATPTPAKFPKAEGAMRRACFTHGISVRSFFDAHGRRIYALHSMIPYVLAQRAKGSTPRKEEAIVRARGRRRGQDDWVSPRLRAACDT
jgi:hypothetical protein